MCLGGTGLDADTVERQGWIKRAAANGVALVSESQRFAADMAAPATLDSVHWLMTNGGQNDGTWSASWRVTHRRLFRSHSLH